MLAHELDQFAELFVGFAGKSSDECSSQHEIRNPLAQFVQQRLGFRPRYPPLHPPQHGVVDMLQAGMSRYGTIFLLAASTSITSSPKYIG